jgi:hypothetical protein
LFPTLFIRLSLDGLAGIQFLIKGKPKHTVAILKSHFYFYHLIVHNYKKRNSLQRTDYYKVKSIVFDYFINKKKTF